MCGICIGRYVQGINQIFFLCQMNEFFVQVDTLGEAIPGNRAGWVRSDRQDVSCASRLKCHCYSTVLLYPALP